MSINKSRYVVMYFTSATKFAGWFIAYVLRKGVQPHYIINQEEGYYLLFKQL